MYKGTKITLRANLYKAKQKAGQKAVNSRCRGAVLRNFATCENSQVANFRNPAKFPQPSFSFSFFLQIYFDSIMHLRIWLDFILFELD